MSREVTDGERSVMNLETMIAVLTTELAFQTSEAKAAEAAEVAVLKLAVEKGKAEVGGKARSQQLEMWIQGRRSMADEICHLNVIS